jgi:hypothetical protein
MSLHPFIQQAFRRLDIFRLAALVPTAEQNHHHVAPLVKIDAVSRAIVDAQFADSLSDRRRVAGRSIGKTAQTGLDQRPCPLVLEPRSPFPKLLRLLQFEYVPM